MPLAAPTSLAVRLEQRIRSVQRVCVGSWYVGLPLAVLLAEEGFSVTGIDRIGASVRPRCG